ASGRGGVARPTSGRATPLPRTNVRREWAIAQDSSNVKVPRNDGMTAPRPSIRVLTIWASGRDAAQGGSGKAGQAGVSQTPAPSTPWQRMQYGLYRDITTRCSWSGLRIQSQAPAQPAGARQ